MLTSHVAHTTQLSQLAQMTSNPFCIAEEDYIDALAESSSAHFRVKATLENLLQAEELFSSGLAPAEVFHALRKIHLYREGKTFALGCFSFTLLTD